MCQVITVVSIICDVVDCSLPDSSAHGILQGKNTGVGGHFLLQGIFLTQGSNLRRLCFLHWQAGSLPLALPGKPKEEGVWISNSTIQTANVLEKLFPGELAK